MAGYNTIICSEIKNLSEACYHNASFPLGQLSFGIRVINKVEAVGRYEVGSWVVG
jgi:hypothetical protein